MDIPRLPIGHVFEVIFGFANQYFQPLFIGTAFAIEALYSLISRLLTAPAWPFIGAVLVALMWRVGYAAAAYTAVGVIVLVGLDLWIPAMDTFALMTTAVAMTLAAGIPLGVVSAQYDLFNRAITPVLDFLQTMPAFIFLIPAVILFGVGPVPAIIATFLYALPVPIRLTNAALRQVDIEMVEAATSFGLTPMQLLVKVQLPAAFPIILAGVNQTVMYSLGMVIIAAMIGAGGLGAEVLRGISRIELGDGFEAGLAVVIVAMILDRLGRSIATDALGKGR